MRVPRVYIEAALAAGEALELDRDTSHYLATVLRLQAGDPVRVFNGQQGEFAATLAAAGKRGARLQLTDKLSEPGPAGLQITLALGLSRGERMDLAVQKSTELGVTGIIPIYSEYGEVRIKQADRLENKLRHWRRIAINACEQSGRIRVPDIAPPRALDDWLAGAPQGLNLLLDPSGQTSLHDLAPAQSINLLIGPEGGFAARELEAAAGRGFTIVHMGERILRTETAPIAALAILQFRFGDM